MSMVSTEKVTCPVCDKESNFQVWQSLNAQLDPEAVPQLLDGSLFRFTCPHCGHAATVEYDLLYHDMRNCVMIYYTQPMSRESVVEQLLLAEKAAPNIRGHKKRIVTSREALAEKIMIFREGMDDRAVELLKLAALAKFMETKPEAGLKDIRFRTEGTRCYLDLMGEKPVSMEILRSFVWKIAADFAEPWEREAATECFFVDDRWALEFLEKQGNKEV